MDAQTLRRLADSDADLDRVVRSYDRLSPDNQRWFVDLLGDDEVGESWLRVVGDQDITAKAVEEAIDILDEVSEFGQTTGFKTGSQVNDVEYPSDFEDVYSPDAIVAEFTLTEKTTFYRMYTEGVNSKASRFLLRSTDDISELSPERLQDKYAIPDDPPDAVSRAEIPEGTPMRTGEVANNAFGSGGGTQYTVPKSQVRELSEDWFEKSEQLTAQLLS